MKKELFAGQFNDNDTLNGIPDWVVALAIGAFALSQANEFVKQVKPLVQPFVDKWQEDRLAKKAIVHSYYLESASSTQEFNVHSELPLA